MWVSSHKYHYLLCTCMCVRISLCDRAGKPRDWKIKSVRRNALGIEWIFSGICFVSLNILQQCSIPLNLTMIRVLRPADKIKNSFILWFTVEILEFQWFFHSYFNVLGWGRNVTYFYFLCINYNGKKFLTFYGNTV